MKTRRKEAKRKKDFYQRFGNIIFAFHTGIFDSGIFSKCLTDTLLCNIGVGTCAGQLSDT